MEQRPSPPQPTPSTPGGVDESRASASPVAERPQLAPGVELSGRMEDSGFQDQQWLILRNGGFVQVTELLFRVAEQANGRHTLDEMARGVSDATGRGVSADNVRQLIETKLIPLGLVTRADGTVEGAEAGDGHAPSRSPLAVNMRMAMISPRLVEPAASVFQILFWPPIFLGLIAIGLLAMAWLFFVHGLAQSFSASLNQPWLILVLLPVIVASAFFHEFGHAAALKYGGGKVRGMGAGFYLMYPAFYTDVTDNYRLSRWSKVRTDTGGFFFHLLFALVVMGLYLILRQEFLLLVVFFIVLQIVHQSLPFVRLDGYWTLADVTGIPDLFSHMGPFLRSLVPIPIKGRKLPALKAWVKLVFILYILITIPLLLVLLFLMISRAPSVLATAWQSFFTQGATFGDSLGRGDWLGALAAGVSILVLLLTTLGFAYFLFTLVKGLVNRALSWSRGSAGKRVVAVGGLLAVAGLLFFLWAPPLAINGNRPGILFSHISPFEPISDDDRWTVQESFGGRAPDDFIAPPVPGGRFTGGGPDATTAPADGGTDEQPGDAGTDPDPAATQAPSETTQPAEPEQTDPPPAATTAPAPTALP